MLSKDQFAATHLISNELNFGCEYIEVNELNFLGINRLRCATWEKTHQVRQHLLKSRNLHYKKGLVRNMLF